jgi:anti-anti-sigma factor
MADSKWKYLSCTADQGVLVASITTAHIQDEKVADGLLQEFLAALSHYSAQKIVVDMHQIEYVSSVAFRPLLHLRRVLVDSGGKMMLCGLSKVVGDVFYTTRLVTSGGDFAAPFELAPDIATAVSRLNSPAISK